MRIQIKRLVKTAALLIFVFLVFFVLTSGNQKSQCLHPPVYQNKLHELATSADEILNKLNVTRFLCYESLWAALYNSGARSWDSTFDLCVLSSDLTRYDEGYLVNVFKNGGLSLAYDSAEGEYVMRLSQIDHPSVQKTIINDPQVTGKLILFTVMGSTTKRFSGWKRRILPPDCAISQSLACFPSRLIEAPLPKLRYGPVMLPSPREELEIQKYHYPEDWWLQRHVPDC